MKKKFNLLLSNLFESAILALLNAIPICILLFFINWGRIYWFVYLMVYVILFLLICIVKLKDKEKA
ncbi:hypothetical protein DF281_07795 [Kurthia zopfii]|nr:hypothetical protein DF281_07795 [Kurthia zopfii]